MTEMERVHLRHRFGGEEIDQLLCCTDDDPDGDFETPRRRRRLTAAWHEYMARNREIVAAAPSLDTQGARWNQNLR